MIDVSQWRASIGLWNYCQAASSRPANGCHSHSKSGSTRCIQEEKRCTLPAVLFIIGFIVFYFCSLLLKQNSIPPPGHCYCYQVQCTTGDTVTDTLQSVVLPGDINIFSLMSRLLLLLSGDVELNPGPTVEETCRKIKEILCSHYATLEDAMRGSLSSIFSHLYAKGIISESVKDSLNYSKMIQELNAKLSYSKDVSELKRHCQVFLECISQGGPTDDAARSLSIKWGQVFDMESLLPIAVSAMISSPPPVFNTSGFIQGVIYNDFLMATSPQQFSNICAGSAPHDVSNPFKNRAGEKKVYDSLDDLHQRFAKLSKYFKLSFREKIKENSQIVTSISDWLIAYMDWEHGSVGNSLDVIFKNSEPYYDFIDCKLLLDMSKEFLQDVTFTVDGVTYKLVDELHSHTLTSKRLCRSKTVSELKKLLQEHYEPFDNLDNLPCIHIHLQTYWDDTNINGLRKLVEKLLPQENRQSIIKHIKIINGSVVIELHILDFTADSLIEYTGGKLQFMHLIGIFSLYINDHPVLQEDENMNFTFELALLEAVTAGNNEAVEFLLQLETVNIDDTNEEGKTALMLACERGHEDIVHSLLSAGANVNIQDNKGRTALMMAGLADRIALIRIFADEKPQLLQTNDDKLQVHQCTGGNTDAPTSTVPVVSTVSSSVSVIDKPVTSTTSDATSYYITNPFGSKTNEEEVYKFLDDLHRRFSNLARVFKKSLQEEINPNSQLAIDVSEWLTAYMEWEHGSVDNNIDDIFKKIHPYYDFIDCKLLLDMSIRFLPDITFTDDGVTYKLVDELHSHTLMSKRLCTSNTVSELKKLLQEHFKPFYSNMDHFPYIHIHLQTSWNHKSIDKLYKLIEKFLPQKYKQSIMKHIFITTL